jgi:hypothetical protein
LTAVAATRARGRAYRDALSLDKIAAEEGGGDFDRPEAKPRDGLPAKQQAAAKANGPERPEGPVVLIEKHQLDHMDEVCCANDFNVLALVNLGDVKYERVEDVPADKAVRIIEYLTKLVLNPHEAPEGVKGFKADWRAEPASPPEAL